VTEEPRNHHGKYLLTLVFASVIITSSSFETLVQNVFADTVSNTIPGATADFMVVNPITNKIYADNEHEFIVIDASTNSVTTTIPFGSSSTLVGVGVNPVTNKIYVGDQNSQVYVIDGNTNSIIANVTVRPSFAGIVANPNTNKIYVASGSGAYVINGSTDTIKSGMSDCNGQVSYLAVNPVTNKIYVPCITTPNGLQGRQAFISVFNGSTDTLVDRINMAWNGQMFGGIAVNPSTNTIYQTDFNNHLVYVFDGNTDTLTNTISASSGFITVNPNTNKVYTSDGANSVNIIDGSTNKVVQTLQVGNSPWEISVNPNTNKIYVANSGSNFVSIIDGNSSNTSTAPSAPQNLNAAVVSSSQINLSWTAPTNNGGSAITGFDIERSADNGNTWSTIVSNTGSATTSYNDTGLAPSTGYTYRVSAINSVGISSPSNTASATTQSVTPPPTGIVLNNIQSTSGAVSSSNQITLSNFNTGTGNNKLLVVGVSADSSDVNSITFNGLSLTRKAGSFYNNDAEFWYLKNPTGTGDVIVTMNGPTSTVVGTYSFSGVNQTSPLPTSASKHNTTPNSPNITMTTKFANDWVLDLPSIYGGSTLGSPTCTQQWDANVPNVITGASSSNIVPTPGAITCKWTASSGDLWDDVAIEIKASK
jgi:YVTN family beta-propeller protein